MWGEHAECRIREFFLGGDFEGQALHSGAFELYAHPGAQVDLAHYQDWGRGEIYDLYPARRPAATPVSAGADPPRRPPTKQRLDIVTAEPGSDMKHTGLYFTERDEHLDLFTSDLHEAGHTTGDTVWKGALTGESRASYEGLIHIVPKASEVDTYPDPLDAALAEGEQGRDPVADRGGRQQAKALVGGTVGAEFDHGPDLLHDDLRSAARRGGARARRGLLRGGSPAARGSGLGEPARRRVAEKPARRRGPGARVHRGAREAT